ncbi:hypothetical protein TELCIR_11047 [Teladorsagia circumcincta]|uniref:Integrase catalytic domain-containing protein n=1 Tax=Teladorsagia circumcincta TaxID=45464 RepID=A0A2G9UAF3_TELCI|nr:hypothetical protein TELCIR_11047 [Teladorsagia circumcincta]
MGATTAEETIMKLREVFSRNGLPEQLVSDNGPPFTSAEFREYCEGRGIQQIFTPPYHPNSNGEAERFVQTFKNASYKGLRSNKTLENAVVDLLFEYRVTPHAATGKAPAEMLMGRSLRTTLDIIKTGKRKGTSKCREEMKRNYDRGKKERTFEVGQEVLIRNYTGAGDRWIPGMVMKVLGSSTYEVHYGMGKNGSKIAQSKYRKKLTGQTGSSKKKSCGAFLRGGDQVAEATREADPADPAVADIAAPAVTDPAEAEPAARGEAQAGGAVIVAERALGVGAAAAQLADLATKAPRAPNPWALSNDVFNKGVLTMCYGV